MIQIKTSEQIEKMDKAGSVAAFALQAVLDEVKVGITTMELEKIADAAIASKGATASFKTVDDYEYATCINVNNGLVHGLPSDYVIKEGDLVSVDMGAYLDGFHSDLSHTVEVGSNKEEDFLKIGEKALEAGISQCKEGNHIGDISHAMQRVIEGAGYTVSRDLVGHGIGKELHEEPYVPGYGRPGKGLEIKENMVFAIEIICQKGQPDLVVAEDDWTIETADGTLAGLFEHTVAATKTGPKVLTLQV